MHRKDLAAVLAPLEGFLRAKDAGQSDYPLPAIAALLNRYKAEHGSFPSAFMRTLQKFTQSLKDSLSGSGAHSLAQSSRDSRKILAEYQELSGMTESELFVREERDHCIGALFGGHFGVSCRKPNGVDRAHKDLP